MSTTHILSITCHVSHAVQYPQQRVVEAVRLLPAHGRFPHLFLCLIAVSPDFLHAEAAEAHLLLGCTYEAQISWLFVLDIVITALALILVSLELVLPLGLRVEAQRRVHNNSAVKHENRIFQDRVFHHLLKGAGLPFGALNAAMLLRYKEIVVRQLELDAAVRTAIPFRQLREFKTVSDQRAGSFD